MPVPTTAQVMSFNTQPPEGGWALYMRDTEVLGQVSTHSRPKAAGTQRPDLTPGGSVSTHSRPKAAGRHARNGVRRVRCFNTQPPEGGWFLIVQCADLIRRFNTQPPEGGWSVSWLVMLFSQLFQHTAARRRLVSGLVWTVAPGTVSTHSRPKAAGFPITSIFESW